MNIIEKKWNDILNQIRQEHDLSTVSFNTWLKPLTVYSYEDHMVRILVPLQKVGLDYVSRKFMLPLKVAITEITGEDCEIQFILPEDVKNEEKKSTYNNNDQDANLKKEYTFDTFVVGSNNQFAHAASLAVAESPGEIYNPLFLYSGVGLGKTHLMHSIAHFILQKDSSMRVRYVTSEAFTNELIEALRNGSNNSMKNFQIGRAHV